MQDDNRYLYGAAGDAFGCYKWDVETGTCTTYNTTTTTGGGGFHNYLHTLDCVPHTNLLLTGGEDGMLAIWDTAQDKLVDTIGVVSRSAAPGISSSSNVTAPPYKRRSMAAAAAASGMNNDDNSHGWISTCKARDENWWTVAGGRNTTSTGGGFVSTWHGPTRSLVSCVETREVPQQLAFYNSSNNNNNNNSGGGNTKLLSVANESFISHWPNPLSLCGPEANSGDKNNYGESHLHSPVRQRVWCHQPSAYAVAVSPDGQRIATGGVGSVVDIFENGTQYGMQLSTH